MRALWLSLCRTKRHDYASTFTRLVHTMHVSHNLSAILVAVERPSSFHLVMSAPHSIEVDGQTFSVEHLAPFVFACPCEIIGRTLLVEATFSNHCYTSGFDAAVHTSTDIVVREHNRVGRVFDPIRFELSKLLPAIVSGLPGCKVNQAAAERNYVYASLVTLPAVAAPAGEAGTSATYQVFFSIRRAGKGYDHDLRLVVESAYPLTGPPRVSKRPSAIRFHVLALPHFSRKVGAVCSALIGKVRVEKLAIQVAWNIFHSLRRRSTEMSASPPAARLVHA